MALRKKIALLGTGNMAEALVKGLLRAGTANADEILCAEPRAERREEIAARYGVTVLASNLEATEQADIVVLSVKPQTMEHLLDEIAPAVDHRKLVISIAAGISIAAIARKLGAGVRIVRTMPNTPALVGAGPPRSRAARTPPTRTSSRRAPFQAVGTTVIVEEQHLDAVTGLSGSGPAFLFLVIEALADGGVKVGLARPVAMALAAQTVLGSAKLVLETGEHPGRLKDQVTSPGGTAIAGVHALEQGGLRAALIAAVEAATRRSHELGERAVKGD
jgi:pyrroline-5-carboxylate reductase